MVMFKDDPDSMGPIDDDPTSTASHHDIVTFPGQPEYQETLESQKDF